MVTKNDNQHKSGHMPTKLTPEVQTKIRELIKEGNYFLTACRACGIVRGTGENWRKRGEKALELQDKGELVSEVELPFLEFYLTFDQADAEGETLLLRDVHNKLDGWAASMTILERKYPDRWGKKERVEFSSPKDQPLLLRVVYDDSDKNRINYSPEKTTSTSN